MGKLWLLLPYMYTVHTRAKTVRDLFANAATSWISGIIAIWCLTDIGPELSILYYFVGYAAFISIYELGYLANDTVGLRGDPTPRDRLGIAVNGIFVVLFVGVRISTFLAAALWMGGMWNPAYLVSVAMLCVVMLLHNTLSRVEIKFATFLQMSVIRYFLPVYASLSLAGDASKAAIVVCIGAVCFTYPRLLTYQEAKGRLEIPGRRRPSFHLETSFICLPFMILVSAVTNEEAPLAVWAWHCVVNFVFMVLQKRR